MLLGFFIKNFVVGVTESVTELCPVDGACPLLHGIKNIAGENMWVYYLIDLCLINPYGITGVMMMLCMSI